MRTEGQRRIYIGCSACGLGSSGASPMLSHCPLLTPQMCAGPGAGCQPNTKCLGVTILELVPEQASQ